MKLIRSTTRRESEWDDEQVEIMVDFRAHQRLTDRCGHHPSRGMDESVGRLVEHRTLKCLDCEAVEKTREKWHRTQGHNGEVRTCEKCADEVFWVEDYVPTPTADRTA